MVHPICRPVVGPCLAARAAATSIAAAATLAAALFAPAAAAQERPELRTSIINPAIDEAAYLRVADDAMRHRAGRRLSEAEFIRLSREPGTVVLDARSKEKFDELHIEGAINLSFPDIAVESLAQTLPDLNTRILIYCNNNFTNAERAFPAKLVSASLNVPTFIALYDYGYRNVWELGPLLDVRSTAIAFASTRADAAPPP